MTTTKVTIDGARLQQLSIKRDDDGRLVIEVGRYDLMGSNGLVLAKQGINSYNDVKYTPSADNQKRLIDLFMGIQNELNTQMGLS